MEVITDIKGKQRRVYRDYDTPWEVFRKLPRASRHLKVGQTMRALVTKARTEGDTAAAHRMQEAKRLLFADLHPRKKTA